MILEIGMSINNEWKVDKLFGETGQGQSAIISKKLDPEEQGVIKVLKDTNYTNNVKRFEQEISLLKRMDTIERVPKIIDFNKAEHYYIMQYIAGKNLEDSIKNKKNRRSFDKILTSVMMLLGIVAEYSKMGIIHRDIKPENIVCHNGCIDDIYLIDFGIGYDRESSNDLTKINDQLGNRFLRLPELLNGEKRDIRSDITMCIGILFFMLTEMSPVSLLNEDGRMPHQTARGIEKLQWVGSRNLQILNCIFDKGFKNDIDERFQRIDDLIFALNDINILTIEEKGRKYETKTDSYCLTTVKKILDVNKIGRAIERLKLYDNKQLAIGKVCFREIENKLFIDVIAFDISKIINSSHNYKCIGFEGLFIKRNKICDEILIKEGDSSFELTAKMNIVNNNIKFTNFCVKNYLYEIPAKKILEPIDCFEINEKKGFKRFNYSSGEISLLYENSIVTYDLDTKKKNKIELNNLFDEKVDYIISSNRKWIFYCKKDGYHIGQWDGLNFIEKPCELLSEITFTKQYAFCREKVILLFENKVLTIDMETGNMKEQYNIKKGKLILDKLCDIFYVSEQGNYFLIKNRCGRTIFIDLNNDKGEKEDLLEFYDHIIRSGDSKFLYKSDCKSIVRENVEDGKVEVVFSQEGYSTIVNMNSIECENYGYFFSLESWTDGFGNKTKTLISIYKVINCQWIRICDIEDEESIKSIQIFGNDIVTLGINNKITVWKING